MRLRLVAAIAVLIVPSLVHADITLKVRPDWIEKYKDRATMESKCWVNFVPDKIHPPSEDGVIHIAVRCEEAGVPAVAEIQNAKKFSTAITFLKDNKGNQVSLKGAWRIWPEHGGTNALHSQANPKDAPFTTSNPDHVVEVHSLSFVGTNDVRAGWTDIQGFKAKDAYTAFMAYESKKFRIRPTSDVQPIPLLADKGRG